MDTPNDNTAADTGSAPAPSGEGVVLRSAVCTACGYRLGGLTVQDGRVTCPECSVANVFELPPRPGRVARLEAQRLRNSVRAFVAVVLLLASFTLPRMWQAVVLGLLVMLIVSWIFASRPSRS